MLIRLGRTTGWSLMLLFSLYIVAYAAALLVRRDWPDELAPSMHAHSLAISLHIVGAMLALGLGPLQFLPGLRSRHLHVHRWMGRLYLLGVLVGGAAGLYLAPYSYGGLITHTGFGTLAVLWLVTGVLAYRAIRARRIEDHRRWMTRNFALTLAGVMLRVWVPLMTTVIAFDVAYVVIAWLCWVPNLVVAELMLRAPRRRQVPAITLSAS